jgi:hypothetical protein
MKVLAGCRAIGPYLLIELILPGGSLVALLLWIYRTTRRSAPPGVGATQAGTSASEVELHTMQFADGP